MKAVLIGPKFGSSNVRIEEVGKPKPKGNEVLVKVTMAGLNPLDYNLINGNIVYNLNPVPHIPGSEIIGIVDEDSNTSITGFTMGLAPCAEPTESISVLMVEYGES